MFHRTKEPASTPIGQDAAENDAPSAVPACFDFYHRWKAQNDIEIAPYLNRHKAFALKIRAEIEQRRAEREDADKYRLLRRLTNDEHDDNWEAIRNGDTAIY